MKKLIIFSLLIAGLMSCSEDPANADKNSNGVPQISSIIPNPQNVATTEVTSLTCLAQDPDGDALNFTWSYDHGMVSGSGSNVDWQAPDSAGFYSIVCTVTDNKGGLAVDSVMIQVIPGNSSPQINALTADFDSIKTNDSVGLNCSATDNDGDQLTYSWSADVGTISGSGNSVTWVSTDSVGSFEIICTVSDGNGGQTNQSIFITTFIPPVPTNGLVAFYPFEGNARDESGNNYDGTLMGNADAQDGTLDLGNNAVDRVYLPYASLNGLTSFTLAAWLKIDVIHEGGLNVWIDGATSGNHNSFGLWYSNESSAIYEQWRFIFNGTGYQFDADPTMKDLNWHHVAVVRDGAYAYLYIDGIQSGSRIDVPQNPIVIDNGGLFIGQEQDALGGSFHQTQSWAGEMDNVRFYNRNLTPDEIESLFNEEHSDMD